MKMRQYNTLANAMDEALKVEVDLATLGRVVAKSGENRMWERQYDSTKKKKKFTRKKNDKPSYYGKCHSSYKGQCGSSTIN